MERRFIALTDMIDELNLEVVYESENIEDSKIYSSEISRPGLQLTGQFDMFVPERIPILGNAEWHYLNTLDEEERYHRLDRLFSYPIPALIVSTNLDVSDKTIELAEKHSVSVLRSKLNTSQLINRIVHYVDEALAETTQMHGVLVEVYGVGVLIVGKSGVGKSETALDLVIRGHRLVSDDVVIIKKIDDILVGTSPDVTRHFLEIRGLGILDIERLYGVGSVKNDENIELVINLENWDQDKQYDRLGLDEDYTTILGAKVSTTTVPVRPGRNVAMIVEVASMNFRQRRLGYNAAKEFTNRINKHIKRNKEANEKRQD